MQGTVKFFNVAKGWGFITCTDGKEIFVHQSNIVMDGFRSLNEEDIVSFEIVAGKDDKEQAVNVTPILTLRMVKNALKEENFHLQTIKDAYGVNKYLVVNADNALQTSKDGMTFEEVVGYAGLHYPM